MVTECRMRRNRSFVFLSSSSSSPLQTSSSPSSTAVAVVAPPTNKQHLHDHYPSVMDSACPINTRSKAGGNIILLLTMAAIFPAFYAMGILLGTTISTYTPWDGDITSMSMPSTMTLRKKTTDENLNIDTVGLSRNERALLKSLSSSPFLRGKVLDMMVQEYISPTTLDNDNESKRESAIEAWQFTEVDDEPIPIQGYPYLFVGSVAASMNHQSLQKNGITHIINWSSSAKCNSFIEIHYLCYKDIRSPTEMERRVDDLDKAVEHIALARAAGGKAMSHCWYGKNRSVTLVVAYLMKYAKLSSEEALTVVQKTRPQAEPYQNVLDAYRDRYLMG